MTPIRLVLLACLPVLGVAQPAMANMPPGPQVALGMISILPLMMLLTLVGGGYAVLRHLGRYGMGIQDLTYLLAGIALLFLAGMNGQVASLITLGFGLIALVRGCKMIVWGLRTRVKQAKPAFLDSAQAGRLLPAGGVLVLLAAFVMGMGPAFLLYVRETPYQADYEQQLQAFVTYQLIYAQLEQAETGKRRFRRFSDEEMQEKFFPLQYKWHRRFIYTHIKYGNEAESFTVYRTPCCSTLFFPYNYLVARPSYRADETGQIKMTYVYHQGERCPAEAPTVLHLDPDIRGLLTHADRQRRAMAVSIVEEITGESVGPDPHEWMQRWEHRQVGEPLRKEKQKLQARSPHATEFKGGAFPPHMDHLPK